MTTWTKEELARRSDDQIAALADRVLNRVCKWRMIYAGWQLGTRTKADPEAAAVRDTRELLILLQIEIRALTKALIDSGAITSRSFTENVIIEAEQLDKQLEQRFPGMTATDDGMHLDVPVAAQTMKGWRP